jgi:hypothetical protein
MEPFKGVVGYHVALTRSIQRILRKGLVPTRGPRSRLLGESRDAVYLFRDRDAVDDALGSWLGDALHDVPLTLLRVTVPVSATLLPTNADYEIVVADRIPPDSITNLGTV